jgi:glycosyltransferase involved in cell wall biosynthesis
MSDHIESSPRVTVLLPVHGTAPHLRGAIDSILRQSLADFELIVLAQGADSAAGMLVQSYADPRLRVVPSGNAWLVTGVEAARGAYLALMVPDGIAHPDRLARQAAFLDSHPDHAAVSAWVEWIDAEGRRQRTKRKPVAADEVAARRLFRSGIEHVSTVARTSVLREYLPTISHGGSMDFDLWSRVGHRHQLSNLPEVLLTRRRAEGTAEDPALRQAERKAIYGLQLRELGIDFTDDDLTRHFLLRRMRKEGFKPDRAYIAWAEAWLRRLQAANRRLQLYPEPMFSIVLGTYWVKVCWHAAPQLGGWAAWRAFRGSPLRRWAWSALKRQILRRRTGSF